MQHYNVGLSLPLEEWKNIEDFLLINSHSPSDTLFDRVIELIDFNTITIPIITRNHNSFNSNFKSIDFLFLEKKTDNSVKVTTVMSRYYEGPSLSILADDNKVEVATLLFTKFVYKTTSHIGSIIHKSRNIIFEPDGYVSFQEFLEECPQYVSTYLLFKINLFNK